ncbi:beta-1,6-N-acetylglucosaminyltransferase [Parasporobacterium paucivorans]|uniref:Peptide O-xylosyltransferase n=1 Tax=Parasporobacterium paucivorans DSM 15970 TaxID=1122934 RepID=A0A1M6EAM8_9FIRM|nr:beta-1,6-N-acetylglucosaminyltransferase [Parasporobacterium paucivorans]SHI82400.1 Core-2/I-Branching enzyme [Parasporobacterium paucivorans DSM 15970]
MGKHAYLIMAHGKFDQLKILLDLLDDPRNDIFLHIDRKAQFDNDMLLPNLRYSKVFIVTRTSVTWGGYSQINCEFQLIKRAVEYFTYDYLHLLSGVDLPIKSQDEIHDFFSRNSGNEYMEIVASESQNEIEKRCKYYWLFQEQLARHEKMNIYRVINWIGIKMQQFLKVKRIPENIKIKKGANWFSITGELAKYIISQEKNIEKWFRHSVCADELFIQTIAYNSEYRGNISGDNFLRLIDWERGNPYIFRLEDYQLIKDSEYLFARKFDLDVDSGIVEMISAITKGGEVK